MSERVNEDLRAVREGLERDKAVAVAAMDFAEAAQIRHAITLLDALLPPVGEPLPEEMDPAHAAAALPKEEAR